MSEALLKKIAQQQKGKEKSPVYGVGEQLKEICEDNPEYCKIVLSDIDTKGMTISDCEKKIHEQANKNGGFCSYKDAEKIIREFYGLPAPGQKPQSQTSQMPVLNLADFM